MKTSLLVLSLLASTSLFAAHYNDDYQKVTTESLSLDGSALRGFSIEAGAGSLKVKGGDHRDIKVTAEVYQKEPGADYCLSLDTGSDNERAVLVANTCNTNNETLIHLTVALPKSMMTKIKDSSGFIEIENSSVYEIKDGSGYIEISNNHTALNIEDGSGALRIFQNEGDITIDDGSGKIEVDSVAGDVEVEDGSGSISVSNANSFKLISDGSGSVTLDNVNSHK